MSDPSAVLRISDPCQLAAGVPSLLGFHPADSLVFVGLRRPRGRVGVVLRLDLPTPEQLDDVVATVLRALVNDRSDRTLVLCYPDPVPQPVAAHAWGQALHPDTPLAPSSDLLDMLAATTDQLRAADVGVRDVLLVSRGRVRSLWCTDPMCCPPQGRAVELDPSLAPLGERQVLPSRAAVIAQLTPVGGPQRRSIEAAASRLLLQLGTDPSTAHELLSSAVAQFRDRLTSRVGVPVTVDELALLSHALLDCHYRDWLLGPAGPGSAALTAAMPDIVRRAPRGCVPDCCAVLAWAAWSQGDGVLAGVAVELGLAIDPDHGLCGLIDQALRHGVPPSAPTSISAQLG